MGANVVRLPQPRAFARPPSPLHESGCFAIFPKKYSADCYYLKNSGVFQIDATSEPRQSMTLCRPVFCAPPSANGIGAAVCSQTAVHNRTYSAEIPLSPDLMTPREGNLPLHRISNIPILHHPSAFVNSFISFPLYFTICSHTCVFPSKPAGKSVENLVASGEISSGKPHFRCGKQRQSLFFQSSRSLAAHSDPTPPQNPPYII